MKKHISGQDGAKCREKMDGSAVKKDILVKMALSVEKNGILLKTARSAEYKKKHTSKDFAKL